MSERYNGGITLSITPSGGTAVTIPTVTSYDPTWETESESFEAYDYSTHTSYKGDRFNLSVTTGVMTQTEMNTLRAALLTHEFTLICPEFTSGLAVRLMSLSQPLEVANYGRKYYRLSFAVASVALLNGSGL